MQSDNSASQLFDPGDLIREGYTVQVSENPVLYPPQVNPYGLYGMGYGLHGIGHGVHGIGHGVHGMGHGVHGMGHGLYRIGHGPQ